MDAGCSVGFLGDGGSTDFEIRGLLVDGTDVSLADGGDVPLVFPPQGGRVVFIGVRATNVDGCGLSLLAAIRDERSHQVRIDQRTVTLHATGDGWGTSGQGGTGASSIASYANVPLCPNQWSQTDVFGNEYQLDVTIQDGEGRSLTKTIRVVPRCAEPDKFAECTCICKAGYVLGEPCAADAGADGGADQ
jgi:hypothetical protein